MSVLDIRIPLGIDCVILGILLNNIFSCIWLMVFQLLLGFSFVSFAFEKAQTDVYGD